MCPLSLSHYLYRTIVVHPSPLTSQCAHTGVLLSRKLKLCNLIDGVFIATFNCNLNILYLYIAICYRNGH